MSSSALLSVRIIRSSIYGACLLAYHKPQEKLVDYLQMRPARLQSRLVVLGVVNSVGVAAMGRGEGSENIGGHLRRNDRLSVDSLRLSSQNYNECTNVCYLKPIIDARNV